MINRTTKYLFMALGLIFVMGSVIAFVLVEEKTPQFWVSYLFAAIALCAVGFGGWKNLRETDQPSSYPFTIVSGIYMVAVVAAIYYGHIVLALPVKWYTVLHILLLTIYLILVIGLFSGHQYITEQGREVRRQVIKARMDTERVTLLIAAVDELPAESRQEAKALLGEVEEKLRYSDPMQSPETAEQAAGVEGALEELEEAVDALASGQTAVLDELRQKAKAAGRKIDAYNRAKKMFK